MSKTVEEIDRELAAGAEQIKVLEARGEHLPDLQTSATALPDWWSVTNAMTVSVAVLLFGAVVMGMVTHSIAAGRPPLVILRTHGTILVVILAVFLIVAGYSNDQITPVIGLLGTIVGYLLGRESSGDSTTTPPPANKTTAGP